VIWFKNICNDDLVMKNNKFFIEKINFKINGTSYNIYSIEIGKTNTFKIKVESYV
jgi:hypothetical protein